MVCSVGEVVEVPLTVFTQFSLGKIRPYRNFDINADTLSELIDVIKQAREKDIRTLTLLLHSFSFLKRDKTRTKFEPNVKDLIKFEKLLNYIKNDANLEVVTIKDFYHLYSKNPELFYSPDFVPNSGLARTFIRCCKHFNRGIKNKIFVFLTFLTGLLIIALASFLILLLMKEGL